MKGLDPQMNHRASIRGRIWRFGDDVNTDVIHPPEFYSLDPETVKRGLFHKLDPSLQGQLRPMDVLVAGENFGCGSSRETSIRSLKLNQVGAVIALSFARIFFRNATNNGLPCVTLADKADLLHLRQGEVLEVRLDEALLVLADQRTVRLEPVGPFIRQIWEAGGLLAMLPGPSQQVG